MTRSYQMKRRIFFFGSAAEFHIVLTQGTRGKFRWRVEDARTGKTRCMQPVLGFQTEDEARHDARTYHAELGIELTEVRE